MILLLEKDEAGKEMFASEDIFLSDNWRLEYDF